MNSDQFTRTLNDVRRDQAERVTLAAGRGVGLDAVRAQVMGLGGAVEVDSVIGVGSVFRMRVPVRALEARESLEAMVCGF